MIETPHPFIDLDMENNNSYQYIPLKDRYEIFKEKCQDEGITPPTFEEYKKRNESRALHKLLVV